MEQFVANVSPAVINAASVLITLFIGIGIKKLTDYVNSRAINESLKADMLKTLSVAEASTKAVIADLSDNVKQALADGNLSKEELVDLQNKAIAKTKEQVPDLEERLNAHINNGSQYLVDVISGEFEKANMITGIQ